MCSQFVFVLKIRIKRVVPLLVHMRVLFSWSSPWAGATKNKRNKRKH